MAERNNDSRDRGKPGRNRNPRARDVQRMAAFKEERALREGDWAASAEEHQRGQEELKTSRQPPPRRRGPPRRPQGMPAPSVTETPPNDDILYDGDGSGSKTSKTTVGHNLDYAGFLPLLEETYRFYDDQQQSFSKDLPFCLWQHTYTELLNASIMSQAKSNGDVFFDDHPDALGSLHAVEINVPLPIKAYIEGATKALAPDGEVVYVNLPVAAVPQGTIHAIPDVNEAGEEQDPRPGIPSGSFGPVDVETHNAYECYVSPYITRRLIERTLEVNTMVPGNTAASRTAYTHRFGDWQPLPEGFYPEGATPNENLLGYRRPGFVRNEDLNDLMLCRFYDSDSILGRLAHCVHAVTRTSAAVGGHKTNKYAKATFTYNNGSATLIYKTLSEEVPDGSRIANAQCPLFSPYSFSASDSNKANYFGYKRKRTERQPGLCFMLGRVEVPGWNATRNRNFEMAGNFGPCSGITAALGLTLDRHRETFGEGSVPHALTDWFQRQFKRPDARIGAPRPEAKRQA